MNPDPASLLREHEPAFGLGNGSSQFLSRLDPFRDDGLDVRKRFLGQAVERRLDFGVSRRQLAFDVDLDVEPAAAREPARHVADGLGEAAALQPWRVEEDGFRSRSTNSWLLGETLTGRVRMTVADGALVFGA